MGGGGSSASSATQVDILYPYWMGPSNPQNYGDNTPYPTDPSGDTVAMGKDVIPAYLYAALSLENEAGVAIGSPSPYWTKKFQDAYNKSVLTGTGATFNLITQADLGAAGATLNLTASGGLIQSAEVANNINATAQKITSMRNQTGTKPYMVTDGTYIYYINSFGGTYSVERVLIASPYTATTIISDTSIKKGLAIANGRLYWATQSSGDTWNFYYHTLGASGSTLILTTGTTGTIINIAVDSTYIYFAGQITSTVSRIGYLPVSGGTISFVTASFPGTSSTQLSTPRTPVAGTVTNLLANATANQAQLVWTVSAVLSNGETVDTSHNSHLGTDTYNVIGDTTLSWDAVPGAIAYNCHFLQYGGNAYTSGLNPYVRISATSTPKVKFSASGAGPLSYTEITGGGTILSSCTHNQTWSKDVTRRYLKHQYKDSIGFSFSQSSNATITSIAIDCHASDTPGPDGTQGSPVTAETAASVGGTLIMRESASAFVSADPSTEGTDLLAAQGISGTVTIPASISDAQWQAGTIPQVTFSSSITVTSGKYYFIGITPTSGKISGWRRNGNFTGGSGWIKSGTWTALKGSGLTLNITASNGLITAVTINTAGTNYIVGQSVTLTGAGNGDATVDIMTVGGGGVPTLVGLRNPGGGYVTATGVTTMLYDGLSGVTILSNSATGGAYGLAVDTTSLYWSSNANKSIESIALSALNSSTSNKLVTGLESPTNIILDSGNVYFTETNGDVEFVPVGGGQITKIVAEALTTPSIDNLVVDSDYVYFTDKTEGYIMKADKTGLGKVMVKLVTNSNLADLGANGLEGCLAVSPTGRVCYGDSAGIRFTLKNRYEVDDIINISGGDGKGRAKVSSVDMSGGIRSVSIFKTGASYSSTGAGSGLTVTIAVTGGTITGTPTVVIGGGAYTTGDTVRVLSGDYNAVLTVTASAGVVTSVAVTNGGSGYSTQTAVSTAAITHGGGITPGSSTTNGAIATLSVVDGGQNYSLGDVLKFDEKMAVSDGNAMAVVTGLKNLGTGLKLNIVAGTYRYGKNAGNLGTPISSIFSIADSGSSYAVGDILQIAGGSGGKVQVTAISGGSSLGPASSVSLVNPGTNYFSNTSAFTDYPPSNWSDAISTVNVINAGSAYATANPFTKVSVLTVTNQTETMAIFDSSVIASKLPVQGVIDPLYKASQTKYAPISQQEIDALVAMASYTAPDTPIRLGRWYLGGDSTGAGCTLNITATSGVITSINSVVANGSGYKAGDIIRVSTGDNNALVQVLTLSGASGVSTVTLLFGGTGYTTGSPIATSTTGILDGNYLSSIPSTVNTLAITNPTNINSGGDFKAIRDRLGVKLLTLLTDETAMGTVYTANSASKLGPRKLAELNLDNYNEERALQANAIAYTIEYGMQDYLAAETIRMAGVYNRQYIEGRLKDNYEIVLENETLKLRTLQALGNAVGGVIGIKNTVTRPYQRPNGWLTTAGGALSGWVATGFNPLGAVAGAAMGALSASSNDAAW